MRQNNTDQSEERFLTVFNNTGIPAAVIEEDTTISMINEDYEKFSGYEKEEIEGIKSWKELAPKGDLERMEKMHTLRRVDPNAALRSYEFGFITKAGEEKQVLATVSLIPRTKKSIVFFLDLTEKKKQEEELRMSEERFRKIFNFSPLLMAINSKDGRYSDVNEGFVQITGYSREEALGKTGTELGIWPSEKVRDDLLEELFRTGVAYNKEVLFYTKKGELRMGIASATLLKLSTNPYVLTVLQDITEQKKLEKEMQRLQRLDLVGEMAAGIGHEIRNPLTTIRGLLQVLNSRETSVETKTMYKVMLEELDRANSIIKEYLSIGKGEKLSLQSGNLNDIINAIYPLIKADAMSLENYVELNLSEIPDLCLDQNEIRQLILNLTRNGLEAMTAGGVLTISTYLEGDEVVLAVKDQGSGIAPDILDKIATPFFTTKDYGTGLGLAISYSIAARHKAYIKFETGKTETTFLVRFKTNLPEC